jgi:hypothetical protein
MTYKTSLYDANQQVVFELGGKIFDSFASVAASCSNRQFVGSMLTEPTTYTGADFCAFNR